MRALTCALFALLMASGALAEPATKKITYSLLYAGVTDTTNAYTLPNGATDLSFHFEGRCPKVTFRLQYSVDAANWYDFYSTATDDLLAGGREGFWQSDKHWTGGDYPPGVMYRVILSNTHNTLNATQILIYIRYIETDETH